MAKNSVKAELAKNPLIATNPSDTVENVRSVLAYLRWVSTDITDERMQEGQNLIMACCEDALSHALEEDRAGA